MLALNVIAQQRWGLVQVDDEHIDIAVIIKVAKGAASAAMRCGDTRPSFVDEFFEAAIAQVAEDDAGRFVVLVLGFFLDLVVHTAGHDEDVGQTIVIEVDDAGTPAGKASFYSNLCAEGHVCEASMTVVAVEHAGVI